MGVAIPPLATFTHRFCWSVKGQMFFVLVDAHFKWPEVVEMKSTTSEKTIEVMTTLFGSYSIPEQVVSGNGPQFTLDEFTEFMRRNRIKHIRCTPYHPSTTLLANQFKLSNELYKQVSRVEDQSEAGQFSIQLSYDTTHYH